MDLAAPILFALGTWWLGTLLLLWRTQRADARCAGTMVVMSLIALLGLVAIVVTRDWTTDTGAYLAFLGGMALWAWHEMSYFLGLVTGPRPHACPPGRSTAQRFWRGVQASLWHELAIVATAAGLAWLTWDQVNAFGTLTFTVLWLMRWSAKLNIFVGVRNLHQEFWPEHLQYLGSFVGQARMNALFPCSMAAGGLAAAWMLQRGLAAPSLSLEQAGWLLLVTLLALALLEHLLMFLRVPDDLLWRLATGAQNREKKIPEVPIELTTSQGS